MQKTMQSNETLEICVFNLWHLPCKWWAKQNQSCQTWPDQRQSKLVAWCQAKGTCRIHQMSGCDRGIDGLCADCSEHDGVRRI